MGKGNRRCPLQAECEKKCAYEGHELDCIYYATNGIGDNAIPDQEKRRQEMERRRTAEWEKRYMAELQEDNDRDLPGEEEFAKPCAPAGERTPRRIGEEIRSLTYQAKCMTVYYGVEIGRRLVEAKKMVGHGAWGDWVKNETEFSQSTATRFMRVFEEYGEEQIGIFGAAENSSTLQNLSISNALRLLAVPKEEREEFAAEVDAEHISARELERVIRERDEARSAAEAARAEASEAEKSREKMAAARVAAETEWKEKLAAAERKLSDAAGEKAALEDKLRELRKKVGSAGAAGEQDRERLAGEVETLKKQLAMSDAKIVTFQSRLETMNLSFAGVKEALANMDAELRKKMGAAAMAQLSLWKKALETI